MVGGVIYTPRSGVGLTLIVRGTSSASTSYSLIQTIPTNELCVQKLPSSEQVSHHDFKKCNKMDNNQS